MFLLYYIIKPDTVIIPKIEDSNKKKWLIGFFLGFLLVSAVALVMTFLLQRKENGLYIKHLIPFYLTAAYIKCLCGRTTNQIVFIFFVYRSHEGYIERVQQHGSYGLVIL